MFPRLVATLVPVMFSSLPAAKVPKDQNVRLLPAVLPLRVKLIEEPPLFSASVPGYSVVAVPEWVM